MSTNRRRMRGDESVGVFGQNAQVPLQDTDAEIFGAIDAVDRERRDAKPVGIHEIYPDFSQPRRAIPSAVRAYWDGQPKTTPELFDIWLKAACAEKQADFDIAGYLSQSYLPEGSEEAVEDAPPAPPEDRTGPIEQALSRIVLLAANIRHVGLTNPITIARAGRHYRLETGERRWLAYHLLNIYFPDGHWVRIPARLVEQFDVWRQASENSARDDLNAIGRARQLAILLMDLLQERGYHFRPYVEFIEAGRGEREFYAQVADGNVYRVPRGQAERLLSATGLKSPGQIRHYRDLLRLDDSMWTYADDRNLTEWEIRNGAADTVTAVTVSPEKSAVEDTEEPPVNPFLEKTNKKRRSAIWSFAARLDVLDASDRDRALRDIEADKRWLEELEAAIRNRSSRGS